MGPQPRTEKFIITLEHPEKGKLCLFAEGPYPAWVERWAREKYEVDPKDKGYAKVESVRAVTADDEKWRVAQSMKYVDSLP
jgi:hypothetical protein